ncbi:MAG: universal stress protein [Chloroflexota bacterium]|nr:universal stress protein [Chloroflexota bacterium]
MELRYERVVVPIKGTASDKRALAVVGQLVHKQPAALTLVYVVEVVQSMPLDAELPAEIAHGEATLRQAEAVARQWVGARGGEVYTELLQARAIGAAVVDEAIERNADAIVMTAGVRRRHGKATLGETIKYVLINAPCEVIVVREPLGEPVDGEPTWR